MIGNYLLRHPIISAERGTYLTAPAALRVGTRVGKAGEGEIGTSDLC